MVSSVLRDRFFGHSRFGARINPGADLGVSIGEVQGAGAAVVTGGDIVEHLAGGVVAVTDHIDDEEAVIDAILPFVDQHPELRGPRVEQFEAFRVTNGQRKAAGRMRPTARLNVVKSRFT